MARDHPRAALEIADGLCAYIRRAAPAGLGFTRENGVHAAVETVVRLPWPVGTVLDLSDADLSNLSLDAAEMLGATLTNATLTLSSLRRADLREADLRAADLTAADLAQADLRGADLTGVRGLTGRALARARIDAGTVVPDHLVSRSDGVDWTVEERPGTVTAPLPLGLALAQARVEAGLTPALLAAACRLPVAALHALEDGQDTTHTHVNAYLRALGVDARTLPPPLDTWAPHREDGVADSGGPGGPAPSSTTRPDGPWDVSEVSDPAEGRVDLGGLFVPGVEGMELRVEVAGDAIVAATVVLSDSAIQFQAFAAPSGGGIWAEVRREIAEGITRQGGLVDETEGPLGRELRAQVPARSPDDSEGHHVVRFVGADGPRWFLRGVITGRGAVQPEAAALLEAVFRDTVVVRGEASMKPRAPIVLTLPEDAQMVPEGTAT
ncbi:DUF3710 domain-containing protein [Streptomyces spongiae]|uniref:DUF3710 domain-containing protein n=1 Tax=Streptomyces spongiae TaxID=565072 RepID=A0A5N8XSS6_9ACTN|nr:DUF3710 domain-containing protein [Streptomyces spongiae]